MKIWDKKVKGEVKFTPSLKKGAMNRAERRRYAKEQKASQQQGNEANTKREDNKAS